MVARDFDQYLFFYEFLNAFTESLEKKLTGKELSIDTELAATRFQIFNKNGMKEDREKRVIYIIGFSGWCLHTELRQ